MSAMSISHVAAVGVAICVSSFLWPFKTLSQTSPAPDCNLDDLKDQTRKAGQEAGDAKGFLQKREGEFGAAEARLKKVFEEMEKTVSGSGLTHDFDQEKKAYEEALRAYDSAEDELTDASNFDESNYEKATAKVAAAETARGEATKRMVNVMNDAIAYFKKQESEWEKARQANSAATGEAAPRPALQSAKLEKLRDSFSTEEVYYDEAGSDLSAAYVDYKRKAARHRALEDQLEKRQAECYGKIDSCLIGVWECTGFKERIKSYTGGGTGFRVTFARDGTETVDYGPMKPITAGHDTVSFVGKASALISTTDQTARVERMIDAGARLNAVANEVGLNWKPKIPGLGAGGLGSVKGGSKYTCTEDSLEFESSSAADGHANCTVKLKRIEGPK